MKLDELDRRHVAGVFALALVVAGLGFVANRDFGRRIEALPETESAELLQQNQLPANAYGSAAALKPLEESRSSADAPQGMPASPPESKFWTEQEWQAASKAVADYRGKIQGAPVWKPPQEIAGQAEKSH